jgi:hypothetical protein
MQGANRAQAVAALKAAKGDVMTATVRETFQEDLRWLSSRAVFLSGSVFWRRIR